MSLDRRAVLRCALLGVGGAAVAACSDHQQSTGPATTLPASGPPTSSAPTPRPTPTSTGRKSAVRPHAAVEVAHGARWQRILQGRHDLGNHTTHHKPMRRLAAADAHREVGECAAVLRRTAGSPGRWFRASGTQQTIAVIRSAAAAAGYSTCVAHDVDGLDWQDPQPATVRQAVLDNVQPGSIVSLHLGHRVTVEALPQILAGLSAKRLKPVTLSELLG